MAKENTAALADLFGGSGPNAPKSIGPKTEVLPVPFSFLSPEKNRGEIAIRPRHPVFGPFAHSRGQKSRKTP
ncbi:hypothetical protein [Rhodobacter capsulatus]|uniref:hypothetical protein n=1 Tax=Rhodobacter capsulatus TaxID=1061 RepID=UPI004026852C